MARMSIDDRFLRDPRVLRMGLALGWSKYETRGRLLEVFAIVYDRVNAGSEPLLTSADIDAAAEWPGLADRMVEFDLATPTRRGMIHVRGAKEHTNYLNTRVSAGRSGGIQSGETRRKKAIEKSKVTFDLNEGRSNPSASASDLVSASDLDLVIPEKNSARPSGGGAHPGLPGLENAIERNLGEFGLRRARKTKPSEASEIASVRVVLDKLTAQNGVRYSGTEAHTKLIIRQLRRGIPEMDMRAVIGYCAVELGWATDDAMVKYLRPETLFGPDTISKYLDPARNWFAKLPGAKSQPLERTDGAA